MIIALVLASCAAWCWPPSPVVRPAAPTTRPVSQQLRAILVAGAALAAVTVLVGLPWWLGGALWPPLAWALGRIRPRRTWAVLWADRRLLAETGDLMAACLEGGHSPGRALADVLDLIGSRVALRPSGVPDPFATLGEVAGMIRLGAAAEIAWQGADTDPDLVGLAAVARRSDSGGAALADGFRDWAGQLRRTAEEAEAAAAGRVGVLLTGPLVCCFLPAFVCLGLAPVVVGLIGSLELW